MKCFCLLVLCVSIAPLARSALPPQYQNIDDLDVMVAYVKQHSMVAAALRSIDLAAQKIHFADNCTVQFVREAVRGPKPGPAAPLQFSNASCAVD